MSTTGIFVASGAALLGFWGIGAYNRLMGLRGAVGQAWLPVDAQLRRRHALALEIVALLGAPEAEAALGDEVGKAAIQTLRAAAQQAAAAAARTRGPVAGAVQSLALAEQVLNGALRPLPVLVRARSRLLQRADLLAQAEALLLRQAELHAQLVFVRRAFNEAVAAFNGALDEMPTRLLAGPLGFRLAAPFQAYEPEPSIADPTGLGGAA